MHDLQSDVTNAIDSEVAHNSIEMQIGHFVYLCILPYRMYLAQDT